MSLRRQAIKLAASLPKGAERTAILQSVAASDKEAKKELPDALKKHQFGGGGDDKSDDKKKDDKKKDDGKMPADLLEKFKGKKASNDKHEKALVKLVEGEEEGEDFDRKDAKKLLSMMTAPNTDKQVQDGIARVWGPSIAKKLMAYRSKHLGKGKKAAKVYPKRNTPESRMVDHADDTPGGKAMRAVGQAIAEGETPSAADVKKALAHLEAKGDKSEWAPGLHKKDHKSMLHALKKLQKAKAADLLEKFKGKKASRNILASFKGGDANLAREIVKLASRMPAQRTVLLDTLRQAAGEEEESLANQGFDPSEISEVEGGPLEQEGDEPYMSDEFTQQEFHELGDLQESGELPTGSDEQKKYASARVAAAKTAATKKFRGSLIRIASGLPKGSRARQDMLHLLAS